MRDFTQGEIGKSIFLFSLPLILGNLFQQLYTLVNSAFVGNFLGVNELAAVGSTYPIVFLLTSLIIGIGSGGSVVVSHYFGAKDYESIKKIISTFYIFFISFGLVMCLLGIWFAPQIFSLINLDKNVFPFAVTYFRIYMIGMFFSVCFNSAISILRGLGDSTTQLYFLISANILNGILSYVFLGVYHYGVASSALSSVISQFIACLCIFSFIYYKGGFLKDVKTKKDYNHKDFKIYFNKTFLKHIINIGLPTGVQQSVVSLTQILILSLVVGFGTQATAAYSSAVRIESIALLFILNTSQSLTSFVGSNFGARNMQRVRKGLFSSFKICALIAGITMIIFCLFGNNLMSLFTTDKEVIRIGKEYLMVSGLFWFIFSVMMMFTAFFRGVGYSFIPMIISIFTLLIVRFPIAYYLSAFFNTLGIWLSAPIGWTLGVIISFIYYKTNRWTKAKIIKTFSFFLLVSLSLFSTNSYAQDTTINKEINGFIPPINIPISSAGNFAELRGTHFHSGLDIRTMEKTGFAVICPADGDVSRIKVQAFGGGKNLYIVHPNGYTTVYMHLERYYGDIETFVKNYQYKHHCYEFDYTFKRPTIHLKQGDTIAISGESGAAAGPHLHYEIRNTRSEEPINPLTFLDMNDTIPPYISSIAINSLDKLMPITIFTPNDSTTDTISAYGNIFFSILAFDKAFNSSSKNGVYKTELFVNDNTLLFSHKVDKFSFNNYGFVDAITNYPLYVKTDKRYLCSRKLSNYNLPFDNYKDDGIISLMIDSIYKITYKLTDIKNNQTTYSFYVKGIEDTTINKNLSSSNVVLNLSYNSSATYLAEDSSVFIFPKNCLYENISLTYKTTKGRYSNNHYIHNIYEPVRKSFTVKIKPYNIDSSLINKYLVIRLRPNGKIQRSIGGKLYDGYVQTTAGDFGIFTVGVDTIPPTITNLNFKNNKKLFRSQKSLKVRIKDNLSGIRSYNAYLNDKWVLMEYDGKNSLLTYTIDDNLLQGKNTLKLVVKDKKNNIREKTFIVIK
ncbi:MAG: MATE family efflux transporter [Bacteroidales bacterium]|jgi:putative MATE family efflux protein|nr:MATE family efflux transporter [Bacteroidales bacterium]